MRPALTANRFSATHWLCGIGILLLLQQLFVLLLSDRFYYEADIARAPVFEFVLSQVLAGLVFLALVKVIPRQEYTHRVFLITLIIGLVLRLLLFGSQPILEIDFYRYLWDGAVTANGFNPYLLAPGMVTESGNTDLQILATDAGPVISRINYAELRTIYPPLTQLVFAVAYLLDEWSLGAWRIALLVFDIATLYLILEILKQLNRSSYWVLIYWWNPLVIHESYNTLHMDILVLPMLLLAMLLIIRHRFIFASAVLALAAGFKLWPLLLLPFALRPLLSKPRELLVSLVAISAISFIVIGPLIYYGLGIDSGLQNYSTNWLRNSAFFPLLDLLLSSLAIPSRIFIALCIGSLAFYLNRHENTNPDQILTKACWLVAILFFLSPTQFPWYTIWFVPLLCFYPQPALILLSALLPIYYLRFYFTAQGGAEIFDDYIIWLQYIPVMVWLLITGTKQHFAVPRFFRHV